MYFLFGQRFDKMRNQIHLNDGKGKFGPALFFGSVASNTRSIAVADINQDGAPDILEVSRGTQNLIFLNDGAGLPVGFLICCLGVSLPVGKTFS